MSLSRTRPIPSNPLAQQPMFRNRSMSATRIQPKIPILPDPQITSAKLCKAFDDLVLASRSQSMQSAVSAAAVSLFEAETATLWTHAPNLQRLCSPAANDTCWYRQGILGSLCFSNACEMVHNPQSDPRFDSTVDDKRPTLLVPLRTEEGELKAVLQVVRGRSFDEEDVAVADAFAKKFALYAHILMPDDAKFAVGAEMIQAGELKSVLARLVARLRRHFLCRTVQFWMFNTHDGSISKFNPKSGDFTSSVKNPGIVKQPLKNGVLLNIPNVVNHPDYNEAADGKEKESALVLPVGGEGKSFAVVLRGKESGPMFTAMDELQLTVFAPLICRSLELAMGSQMDEQDVNSFAERLQALLEVAEIISSVMDIEILVPTIMERACSLLATERCSVFIVDAAKKELVTQFQGGLEKKIRMPMNRGIVGHTATTGNIVNITDAYSDPRFDKAVDLATGFKTRTILTVPIYNNRGEIAGVTEMINRSDGQAFDDDDIKVLKVFNVFCGISLDNSKMYQVSLDLTRQLRGFVEMSAAMSETKKVQDVLMEILKNAMDVVHANRGTIYLRAEDEDAPDALRPFVTSGSDPGDYSFAKDVMKSRKAKVYSKEEETQENEARASRRTSLLENPELLNSRSDIEAEQLDDKEYLCGFPLLTNDTKILGVMEFSCPSKILPEDMKLLDCFSVFASVSLERSELKEIAKLGHVEVQVKQYIAPEERETYTIPAKLRIDDEHSATLFAINFDAPAWDGIGHFKVLWRIMDTFHLFEEFKITNEKFFKFVSEISQTYNKVPYHNWRHAVDVTQFCTYELKLTHFDEVLTRFELLGFVVSAICHDANHDGFTNVYNVKAETPLGILFKNQSVMETHHCTVAIDVMSKEECNLFSELNATEFKNMWTLVIQLILITDMAKHFDFLKQVNATVDEGKLDTSDPAIRLMMMQGILKCGDISNVSRPFELADKWCDVLCEEFFRQGDLEMANGMEYTSPLNDREHLDKPKSQIGFYTFVCLPLYEAVARMFPALQANVEQVKSNLAVWKKATEEREAAANK